MKRLTYTLAALAMLIWACPLAHAEFMGSLLNNQEWFLIVNNAAAGGKTGVTVTHVGKNRRVLAVECITVDIAARTYAFPKPGNRVRRIIIDVDPPKGATIPVEVVQAQSFPETCVGATRILFDLE